MATREQLYMEVLRVLLTTSSDPECQLTTNDLFHRLSRRKRELYNIRCMEDLEDDLEACNLLFELETSPRYGILVSPKTSLNICRHHSTESGSCADGACPDLHFCVFFLLSGNCCYGDHCLFGHDLRRPHNQLLLRRHLLQGLTLTELRTLFTSPRVRQGVTLPQLCRYFNVYKGCNKRMDCRSLHLCRHYVRGQCRFGVGCNRNHDMDHPQVRAVLTLFGVKVNGRRLTDLLREVQMYDRKHEAEADMDDDPPVPRRYGARSRRSHSVPPNHSRRLQIPSNPQPSGAYALPRGPGPSIQHAYPGYYY